MATKALVRAAGFFVLRTPLLAFDDLEAWSEGLEAPAAFDDSSRLDEALASDRRTLRARLRDIVALPAVREALFVASPSLDERLSSWLEAPDTESGRKVEGAIVRYFARMAGRPTPFGLFAGCSVGGLGVATRLSLTGRESYSRRTRLDMDYLSALAEALGRDPDVRPSLTYRPSSSLYRSAGKLRYVEVRTSGPEGKTRSHHLVAVEESPYLAATLERCREGARLDTLADALVRDDPDVTREEADAFLAELASCQMLASGLAPTVTGALPTDGLIALLRATPAQTAGARTAAGLEAACDELAAIDEAGLGSPPSRYRAVAHALSPLAVKPELPRLFQVDLAKPGGGLVLGERAVQEVLRAVDLLSRISPSTEDPLAAFRRAFLERWDRREIPLALALDEESGLGFGSASSPDLTGSPLLEDLRFPAAERDGEVLSRRHAYLLRRLEEVWRSGSCELVLQEDDLTALENAAPLALSDGLSLVVTIAAASPEALDRGELRVIVHSLSGPSGGTLLGRFCHVDPAMAERVATLVRAEEALRPNVVHAEVVHLPEGRVGNILLRPLLRDHEIVFLGASGAPRDKQISIDDLSIAVDDDRVVLRSKRLGREVVPHLTNAHDFSARGVALYRFLGALQMQGAPPLGWSWGALDRAAFLPRVVSGRIVLALARWLLGSQDLAPLEGLQGALLFRAVQRLRSARDLPRHIAVADGDNLLPIDLDNVLSVDAFGHAMRGRSEARVIEAYPSSSDLCVRGPEGRFVHEIIVPLLRTTERSDPTASRAGTSAPIAAVQARSFVPGSEWLYAKLYCGNAGADDVLRTLVSPLFERVRASGAADRCFFLRYGDPEWHVRARLHGRPERLAAEVLPALHELATPLLERGLLYKIQLDTYEREVERYGGHEGTELSERLFEVDSDAALAILDALEGDPDAESRWQLAFCSIARLLCDLGLDLSTRLRLVAEARATHAREFRAGARFERQLGEMYRKQRSRLFALLTTEEDEALGPGLALLAERSERLVPIVQDLRNADAGGLLAAPVSDLASSYMHMTVNRLVRTAARAHELVLYDMLRRSYESQAARAPERPR